MKTFAIHTLGCKVNSYESEAYIERCLELGYVQKDFKEPCDLYLINTCAVTNTASSKSRQKIHQAIHQNKDAYIAVIGCYSQAVADELKKDENIDAIVGSDGKDIFLDELEDLIDNKKRVCYVHDLSEPVEFENLHLKRFSRHTRAFLKIQDGCNQFCSYCIIPFTRGRERSMEKEKVLELAKRFVENGHHEIVLSGIHTGRYGKEYSITLADLLKEMLEIEGLDRIRISSIEMNEVSDELIDLMISNPKIAHHLHIPVQSCSNEVLKRMNRPYTIEEFINRVNEIRSKIPTISISTDIIAGFADESDEEHNESVENAKKIGFSFMHVFPYSKRDHTVASQLKQIHGTIRKQRAYELNELSASLKQKYIKSWNSKVCHVLVESCVNGVCSGYSSEYLSVKFMGDASLIGKIVAVRIDKIKESFVYGSLEG